MTALELKDINTIINNLTGTLAQSEEEIREKYGEHWYAYFYGS